MKEKLLSVTAKDCRWDYYRGKGKGGQKKNVTDNCARCTHEPSGAVGRAEDGRSKEHNKRKAFFKMSQSEKFKKWLRVESMRRSGEMDLVKEKVKSALRESVVEIQDSGKWTQAPAGMQVSEWDVNEIQ